MFAKYEEKNQYLLKQLDIAEGSDDESRWIEIADQPESDVYQSAQPLESLGFDIFPQYHEDFGIPEDPQDPLGSHSVLFHPPVEAGRKFCERTIGFTVENLNIRGGVGLIRNRTQQCQDDMRRVRVVLKDLGASRQITLRLEPLPNSRTYWGKMTVDVSCRKTESAVDKRIEGVSNGQRREWKLISESGGGDLTLFLDFNHWREETLVAMRLCLRVEDSSIAQLCVLLWGRKEIKHMGQTKGFQGKIVVVSKE